MGISVMKNTERSSDFIVEWKQIFSRTLKKKKKKEQYFRELLLVEGFLLVEKKPLTRKKVAICVLW